MEITARKAQTISSIAIIIQLFDTNRISPIAFFSTSSKTFFYYWFLKLKKIKTFTVFTWY